MNFLKKSALPLLIWGIGIAALVGFASLKAGPATKPPTSNVPKVSVEPINPDIGTIDIHLNGNVMPHREIRIAAEVAGRIIEKSPDIRAGRFIEEDAELCKIDPKPYELELQRLEQELAQADIDLQQLELESSNTDELIALAQKDVDRVNRDLDRLMEARSSSAIRNSITDAQIDAAQGEVTRMENALQTLKNTKSLIPSRRQKLEAQKKLIETRKQIAQLDKDRTTVKSPISGVIATEAIEEGDFVQRGTELLVVEDVSQMEVSCNLLTEDLYWIWASSSRANRMQQQMGARDYYAVPDIRATITLTVAQQRFQWSGQLVRFEGSALNEKTRTVPCRIRVDQPINRRDDVAPPSLARGMFVSVTLHVPPAGEMVRIPEEALRMNGRIYTTFTGVSADGSPATKLQIHQVEIARAAPGAVLVQQSSIDPPISPGAQLVVSPLQYATDKMDVEIAIREDSAPDGSASPSSDRP